MENRKRKKGRKQYLGGQKNAVKQYNIGIKHSRRLRGQIHLMILSCIRKHRQK